MSRLYVLDNKDGTARISASPIGENPIFTLRLTRDNYCEVAVDIALAQDIVDGLALLELVRRVTAH
jgi:hypothetical protein